MCLYQSDLLVSMVYGLLTMLPISLYNSADFRLFGSIVATHLFHIPLSLVYFCLSCIVGVLLHCPIYYHIPGHSRNIQSEPFDVIAPAF